MKRRQFLRVATTSVPAGLAALGLSGCASTDIVDAPAETMPTESGQATRPMLMPKVNGGINIHPLRVLGSASSASDMTIAPELVAFQVDSVYSLGFDGIRLTAPLSDRGGFLAAIAYVRAVRALGIDAVVIMSEFAGLTLPRALADPKKRSAVVDLYGRSFVPPPNGVNYEVEGWGRLPLGGQAKGGVGRIALQVLNEPASVFGIPPVPYVEEFLGPTYHILKSDYSDAIVVSAAEIGSGAGPARMVEMLEAGLEKVTDRVAFHIYTRDVIPLLAPNVRSLVWITESGAHGTANHLPWVRDVFPDIKAGIPDVSRIFFYDLYDPEPGGYRILDFRQTGDRYERVIESREIHDHFDARARNSANGPIVPFSSLIPDIRAYLPTPADVALYDLTMAEVLGS